MKRAKRKRAVRSTSVHHAEKSIAIDFDAPVHNYSRGWFTKDIYDPPTPGAHDALRELSAVYGVFILSARPAKDILPWCRRQFPDLRFELIGPKVEYWNRRNVIGITNRKLPALAYIDDRAIRFTSWMDIKNYFR